MIENTMKTVYSNMCLPNAGTSLVMSGIREQLERLSSWHLVDLLAAELERSEMSETNFRWLPLLASLLEECGARERKWVSGLEEEAGPEYKAVKAGLVCVLRWERDLLMPLEQPSRR